MNSAQLQVLRQLVQSQRVASLGTLHEGEPSVSMVPYALLPAGAGFVIHVSELAAHTRDMLSSPRVSLLVLAEDTGDVPPQALPRVTVRGEATQIPDSAPGHAAARDAYLSRFPQSAGMFALGDFSLFTIRPLSVRLVAGFGQALTLTPDAFATALGEDRPS